MRPCQANSTRRSPTPPPRRTGWTGPTAPTRGRRTTGTGRPTSVWSAAGSRGCGRRSWPRSVTRRATSCCSRATGSGGRRRAQRRVLRGLPHPRTRERRPAVARRDRDTRAAGPGEPRRDRGDADAVRRRLRLRAAGRDHRRDGAAPPRVAARHGRGGPRRDVPRRGRDARRGQLTDLPGRRPRAARHGPGRPREAGLGSGRGRRVPRGAHPRGHARHGRLAGWVRRRRAHGLRCGGACRQGRARDQRVPVAGTPPQTPHRARLRLRADDRAAVAPAAGRDRLAGTPGHGRHDQPVPLLPDDQRRPDPVGRVRRDLPLRAPCAAVVRPAARDVRPARPAVLHDVPAAGGAAVLPPLGRRDRHLHALLRLLRHGVRRPRGVRPRLHRPRRRRDALRRRRDARPPRRRRLGADPAGDGADEAAALPARAASRGPASSSPVARSPPPTATRGDATPGCAPSIGSASASTPDGGQPR